MTALRLDTQFDTVQGAWRTYTQAFRASAQGQHLVAFVQARLDAGAAVYPTQVLRALALTPLETVKVVILGQDPYHGPGQAEGLAFSVAAGCKTPPSLRNIFKELQRDLGQTTPRNGSLVPWAERGVLLLNTTLSVEDGQAASHAKRGWEALTDALVQAVAQRPGRVFMLWGAHAQAKSAGLSASEHLLLQSNHPSPLSASRGPVPFVGCGHFSRAASYLAARGERIDWSLPS